MYKIVAAINSMIEKADLISNVVQSQTGELYFLYNSKFTWSLFKNEDGNYFLHYYPGSRSPEELASIELWDVSVNYVTYSTSEIKTKEASESFSGLYTVLQGKLYNIDSVLDQIISTAV